MIQLIQQSCLEKIRPDAVSFKRAFNSATALVKEEFAYQIVLYSDQEHGETVHFSKQLPMRAKLYLVKNVPVNWPHFSNDMKEDYLLDSPGFLPDALVLIDKRTTLTVNKNVTVLWVSVTPDHSGDFNLLFRFSTECQELESVFTLHVLKDRLPPSDFTHTAYIDPCGIASAFRVPLYSDVFWDMLRELLDISYFHGINSILTPIFPVYYEELIPFKPTQLVQINMDKSQYVFNFDLLDSWLLQMKKCDIRRIVIPPIFPSFKTLKCPKIIGNRFRRDISVFSDDVTITSPEYIDFMKSFLGHFLRHMKNFDFIERIDFQLTHDPAPQDEAAYSECRKAIKNVLRAQTISNSFTRCDFSEDPTVLRVYLHNAASCPETPKEVGFDVNSQEDFCNLLIAAPAARLRAFGLYAYRYNVQGLFDLGFNYNTSAADGSPIDLYCETDYESSYPSGSCHLVYPGFRAPIPSIRLKLLHFALQDLRVLKLLERSLGRERVVSLIDAEFDLSTGPISPEKLLAFREKVHGMIDQNKKV